MMGCVMFFFFGYYLFFVYDWDVGDFCCSFGHRFLFFSLDSLWSIIPFTFLIYIWHGIAFFCRVCLFFSYWVG